MKHPLNILVLMDALCIPENDPEFISEPPDYYNKRKHKQSTELYVVNALRELGHYVTTLGIEKQIEPVVTLLSQQKPDVVFNLTENFHYDRRMDMHIAALLEMFKVPFTGTGSEGLMLCRNKGLSKQILRSRKIHVPGFYVLHPGRKIHIPKSMHYPHIVKPLYEDGSDGISNSSIVNNFDELFERVTMVHDTYNQPAIVEEYIEGRELYVSVIGNKKLKVLPSRELFFQHNGDGGPMIATSHVKWNEKYQKKWKIKFGFSDIDEALEKRVAKISKKVFRLMQIHDYGRIDMRITDNDQIFIIEANPNPGLACGDEVAESAAKAGMDYVQFIDKLLSITMHRYADSEPI